MLEASLGFIFFLSSLPLSVEDRLSSHCCRIFLEDIQLSPRLCAGAAHCPPRTSVPLATSALLVLRRSQVQFQGFPSKYRWRRRGKYSKTLRSKRDILLFRKFKTWSCFKSFSSCSPTSSMSFPFRSSLARVSGSLSKNKTIERCYVHHTVSAKWYLSRHISCTKIKLSLKNCNLLQKQMFTLGLGLFVCSLFSCCRCTVYTPLKCFPKLLQFWPILTVHAAELYSRLVLYYKENQLFNLNCQV